MEELFKMLSTDPLFTGELLIHNRSQETLISNDIREKKNDLDFSSSIKHPTAEHWHPHAVLLFLLVLNCSKVININLLQY